MYGWKKLNFYDKVIGRDFVVLKNIREDIFTSDTPRTRPANQNDRKLFFLKATHAYPTMPHIKFVQLYFWYSKAGCDCLLYCKVFSSVVEPHREPTNNRQESNVRPNLACIASLERYEPLHYRKSNFRSLDLNSWLEMRIGIKFEKKGT